MSFIFSFLAKRLGLTALGSVGWWAVGLFVVAAAAGGAYGGYQLASNACEADKYKAVTRAIEQANEQAEIDAEIYRDHVEVTREIDIVYKEIDNETETVTTPECTDLGDEWVRVFNDSVRATD